LRALREWDIKPLYLSDLKYSLHPSTDMRPLARAKLQALGDALMPGEATDEESPPYQIWMDCTGDKRGERL